MLRKSPTLVCLVYGVFTLLQACDSSSAASDAGVTPTGGTGGGGAGGQRADAGTGGGGGTHPLADAAPVAGALADAGPVVPDQGQDAGQGGTPVTDAAVPTVDGHTPPGGCIVNEDCDAADYCSHPNGECEPGAPTGVCVPRGECEPVDGLVCGCDGQTYASPCEASAAGVNLADIGACPSSPGCATDVDCGPDDRCDPCAHGSCPACDDCVAECVPHNCQSENQPACNAIRPMCAEGETAVVRDGCWLCVELATCEPPAPPGACAALGGYCEDFQAVCRPGYSGQPPMDCPHGRSDQCCVPDAPVDCLPAGGMGAVVPGALPCCPGVTNAGCVQMIDGACQACVGGYTCIAAGDGVCGAGENVCNSLEDCP